jgi:hypothetical protein
MKKLTPTAAIRILKTGRVGVISNSFHTPCPFLEKALEFEAAFEISASLNSASPLFSDVLIKTCFASSSLPVKKAIPVQTNTKIGNMQTDKHMMSGNKVRLIVSKFLTERAASTVPL